MRCRAVCDAQHGRRRRCRADFDALLWVRAGPCRGAPLLLSGERFSPGSTFFLLLLHVCIVSAPCCPRPRTNTRCRATTSGWTLPRACWMWRMPVRARTTLCQTGTGCCSALEDGRRGLPAEVHGQDVRQTGDARPVQRRRLTKPAHCPRPAAATLTLLPPRARSCLSFACAATRR